MVNLYQSLIDKCVSELISIDGPDNVPGPAYVDPGNPASSPSMAIHSGADLCDKFSWEETYQKNVDEGNGWKNRLPIR